MRDAERDFEKIYQDFFPRITGYLRQLAGDDAEDLAQEVFLKMNAALRNFRGDSSLSTWIYRIATNTAIDHLRKIYSGRSPMKRAGEDCPEGDQAAVEEGAPLIDSQLIRKEMNECIRGIVYGLPENARTVLVMSEMGGLTNSEISNLTGLSLEAVKIRLHRARKKLRKELESKCVFYRDERNELACDRKPTPLKFHKT